MTTENLFLCMGSACHQLGVYEVLPQLQKLIETYGVEDCITLKGSFCLELCNQGITMKFQDYQITNITPHNVEEKFVLDILPLIKAVTSST
ncbi:MAG: (2Fe-2S) ferredoxin domain-containing protein [Leptolyngbyaceae bacterium]|nr:(2Fe-2S) ferredoxin domain-containing protein [Leptolyngbyaceae bacterium]